MKDNQNSNNTRSSKKDPHREDDPSHNKASARAGGAATIQKTGQKSKDIQRRGKDASQNEPGFFSLAWSMSLQFLREARTELKKVKWPTRKELLASTIVVLIVTFFVAIFLGLVDFGLIKIIKFVVQ